MNILTLGKRMNIAVLSVMIFHGDIWKNRENIYVKKLSGMI